MTNLSPAALAVMTAGTMGNHNVINDPVYRQCIAAALRAAAEQLGYHTNPGPSSIYNLVYDDSESDYRVDVADLLAIADELEGDEA
jgi:hypothetical protein